MKLPRRRAIILVLVFLGLGAAFWGAKQFLASRAVARKVADRLAEMYGAPVEVAQIDVGVSSTALRGVQLFEAKEASAPSTPWLTADEIETDLSAWDLVRGETTPQRLTVDGAAVTLRLNQDGDLLTRLPTTKGTSTALPDITIHGGQIAIHQEGRPTFVLTAVEANVHADGDRLTLSGKTQDPTWGAWTLEGLLDRKQESGSVVLKADRAPVTQAKLAALPWVSPKVWKEVHAEGETPVEAVFRIDPEGGGFHYRITIQPDEAQITVRRFNLQTDHTRGKAIIDDGRVVLEGVNGNAAGGRIVKLDGDLNFESDPEKYALNMKVEGLNLEHLPKDGPLFAELSRYSTSGQVSGTATLKMSVDKNEIVANFDADGSIAHASLGAAELTNKPISFHIHAADARFPVNTAMQKTRVPLEGALAVLLMATLPPEQQPNPNVWGDLLRLPTQAVSWMQSNVGAVARTVNSAGQGMVRYFPGKPVQPGRPEQHNYADMSLGMEDVDLAQLLRGLSIQLPVPLTGRLTFDVHASIPTDAPRDLKLYRVEGNVTLSHFTAAELTLEQVRARLVFRDGVLRLEDLQGRVPGGPQSGGPPAVVGTFSGTARVEVEPRGEFSANLALDQIPVSRVLTLLPGMSTATAGTISARLEAHVGLSGTFPCHANVTLQPFDLSALPRLFPQLSLPASLAGRFEARADAVGQLSPFELNLTGTAGVSELALAGFTLGRMDFKWSTDGQLLRLTDLQAHAYEGQITGTATVPLKETEGGSVVLRFKNLDVAALARAVPSTPVRLEGRAEGSLQGTITAAKPQREFEGKLSLQAPQLRIQGIAADRLTGALNYRRGVVDYRLEGETLGGRFHVNGKVPTAAQPKPAEGSDGEVRLEGIDLSRLGRATGMTALEPLSGVLDLDFAFQEAAPDQAFSGKGRIRLSQLAWGESLRVGDVAGDLTLRGDEVRLRELTGTLGQGELRAQLAYNVRRPDRSWFTLTLEQVEAERLLAPWPGLADLVSGPLDIRLRGRLGREWSGNGEVHLARGKVDGLEVNDLHLPFDLAFAPGPGNAEITIESVGGQVAQGRVAGRATIQLGMERRLEGHLDFYDVNLATVLRELANSSSMGSGLMTGRIDFAATDLRSVNDLTAGVQATLRQAQALQMPVLQQVAPFIAPGQSSALFGSGELRGRLANGSFRLERGTVSGSYLKLFVEGTVTLQGRLNLQLAASTGNVGPNPAVVRLLAARLPLAGPIPIGLLTQANNYLSNRTAHLAVLGTIRSPVIQVQPVRLLTEEAVRFFLVSAGVPIATPLP